MNTKINILCLDDEQRILNSLRALFRLKYNVFTALTAKEAIDILRNNDIAVVISDQRMPEMTGSEFLEIAKKISPKTTRILLTGFSDIDAVVSSVNDSEVYRFLTKPWGNGKITNVVEEAVEVFLAMSEEARKYEERRQSPSLQTQQSTPTDDSLPDFTASMVEIPRLQSYVIYKNVNTAAFEEIKSHIPDDIILLHARNIHDVYELLQTYPVKIIISFLSHLEEDIDLLKFLKRELPELLSIGLVEFADYEEIVTLINEAKLYRYIIMPVKSSQLVFFLNSALKQYDRFNANPQLLKQQKVIEDQPIQSSITQLFGSFFNFFTKKKSRR